jgi:glycosyltransferase involved in cell wall biosynthesis
MKQRKLALVGVYPPPVGGISVHIQRLCRALDERGIPVTVYDNTAGQKEREVVYTGKIETWALRYLFTCREDVVHVHFLRWQVRLLLSLLALRGKRVIITVHNMRGEEQPLPWWKRLMVKLTGRLAHRLIVVNPTFVDRLAAYGVDREKIVYIPPFIPGPAEAILLSPELEAFLAGAATKLLLANGAVGSYYKGGDLYGIDLLLALAERLAAERDDLRFIFCVTHVADEQYYDKLQRQLAERGLAKLFRFLLAPPEYQTLLRRAAVFLRPTRSESYGISLYEALHAGVPVVASDAALRPPQTVLFADGNLDDFAAKTLAVLNGEEAPERREAAVPDYAEQIIAQYGL